MEQVGVEDRDSQRTTYFLERRSWHSRPRKVEQIHRHDQEARPADHLQVPFVKLLGGDEPDEMVQIRWKLFNESWSFHQERIHELLESANAQVVSSIEQFVIDPWDAESGRVATAILLPGSNIANHLRLFSQIRGRMALHDSFHLVSITSKECPNLKTALKIIVNRFTSGNSAPIDEQEDENDENDLRYDRRLNYDLDILYEWCKKEVKVSKSLDSVDDMRIIICIEDADSFPVALLTGLIKSMQSYTHQIPFKLMISVATSLEVFEEKLPQATIRMLQGTEFQAEMKESISRILGATILNANNPTLMLGTNLFNSIVQRQNESLESVDTVIASLKYIFMSHFYSNPFSVLMERDAKLSQDHIEALRMLRSFKVKVESAIATKDIDQAEKLLTDDDYVRGLVSTGVKEFQAYISQVMHFIDLMVFLHTNFASKKEPKWSKLGLYTLVISGQIPKEPKFTDLLAELANASDKDLVFIVGAVDALGEVENNTESEYLSRALSHSTPNARKSAYLDSVKERFGSYQTKFLSEAFVSDAGSLQENVFLPTYRAAMELALTYPKHYWGDVAPSTAADPHIAVLYQLYRESSVFINIYDYYIAFKESIARPADVSDDEWKRKTMAWFLQGIAELKFVGILRDSKRKFECVEKITWKDL